MSVDLGFTQNFREDFKKIRLEEEPYAFIRFGDGAILFATETSMPPDLIKGRQKKGEWTYDGSKHWLSESIRCIIESDMPGVHLGISCPCCHAPSHKWYMEHLQLPKSRVSFANLFVNGNYDSFLDLDLKNTVIVSTETEFKVPKNGVSPIFDHRPLVEKLFKVRTPILVAAGPLAKPIIYDYWLRASDPQIILDVGSALDPIIYGEWTRGYHHPDSPIRKKICSFKGE